MVLADAICAMNLAVSTIVNGVCCCYQMNEDTKRHQKQEEVLTNVFRREFYRQHEHEQQKMLLQPYDEPMIETSCDSSNQYHNENHYNDAFACGNNDNRHMISSNRYNDAFACASRWRDEHRHKEMAQAVHKYCYSNTNTNNSPRENPPSFRDGRFYDSLIAPSQSFSSVITKKSDNRFRLQDQMPELFSVASSLSRFSSLDSLKELPHSNSSNNYYHELTTTNTLSPIKPGLSLLDNIVDDEDDENSIRREEVIDVMEDRRDDIIDLQEVFIE